MLVKYVGNGKLIMTDYNGGRYTFEKDVPKDIAPEIFNHIVASGLIEAKELEIILEAKKQQGLPEKEVEGEEMPEVKDTRKYKRR